MAGWVCVFEAPACGVLKGITRLPKAIQLALRRPYVAAMFLLATPVQAVPVPVQPLTTKAIARFVSTYGEAARVRMQSWQRLVADSVDKSETEKVALANDFFNRLEFASDAKQWGVTDFWATPLEMLARNGGDCEDYAIAKYTTLRMLGIPVERLRITHAVDWRRDQSHMVLLYYPLAPALNQDALVLDNRSNEIMPLSRRMGLLPVYGFNSHGLWLLPKEGVPRRSSMRLAQWQALNVKMQQQGLQL
jgi:predicted transglutaminase-like cysteine proteinase